MISVDLRADEVVQADAVIYVFILRDFEVDDVAGADVGVEDHVDSMTLSWYADSTSSPRSAFARISSSSLVDIVVVDE